MRTAKRNETDTQRKERFYTSPDWRRLRKDFIQYHPLCESCLQDKKVKETEECHHIIKWDDQPTELLKYALFTDEDNILNLCSECHNRFHHHFKDLSINQQNFFMQKIKNVKNKYDKMFCNINTEGTIRDMMTKASLSDEQKKFQNDLNKMIGTGSEMNSKKLFD